MGLIDFAILEKKNQKKLCSNSRVYCSVNSKSKSDLRATTLACLHFVPWLLTQNSCLVHIKISAGPLCCVHIKKESNLQFLTRVSMHSIPKHRILGVCDSFSSLEVTIQKSSHTFLLPLLEQHPSIGELQKLWA